MRRQSVKIAGKIVQINELRVSELKALIEKVGADFLKTEFGAGQVNYMDASIRFLQDHVSVVFPDLTGEDLENAYPSEIEALVEGFIDVNFFGVRRIAGSVLEFAERMARLNSAPGTGSAK